MEQSVANLVDMRDVSFTRGNRCIFDNISLTVPRGKITAIMGPSGIGKTTLLRLIGGQIAPDHGEILFDGENIPAPVYSAQTDEHVISVRGVVH